jgi:hypothetical protein
MDSDLEHESESEQTPGSPPGSAMSGVSQGHGRYTGPQPQRLEYINHNVLEFVGDYDEVNPLPRITEEQCSRTKQTFDRLVTQFINFNTQPSTRYPGIKDPARMKFLREKVTTPIVLSGFFGGGAPLDTREELVSILTEINNTYANSKECFRLILGDYYDDDSHTPFLDAYKPFLTKITFNPENFYNIALSTCSKLLLRKLKDTVYGPTSFFGKKKNNKNLINDIIYLRKLKC